MLPINAVSVSSVAELPTCHQTLQADLPLSPLVKVTLVFGSVVNALGILKTKRAFELPSKFKVSAPVNKALLSKQ
jgi:hypothetical protein